MAIVKQNKHEEKKEETRQNNGHPDDFEVSGPRNLSPATWKADNYKRTVIACFIKAAYLLELDRQEEREGDAALAPKWWESFNYKLVEALVDERDGSIFGATLEWDSFAALSGLPIKRPRKAPQAVIVLRGTLLRAATMINDIEDDLTIFLTDDLSGSCRFSKTLEAVSKVVGKYGSSEVFMAGHSLGAGVALQVGMALALKRIIVETHLFNPPSVSLPLCLRGIVDKLGILWNDLKGMFTAILPSEKNRDNDSEDTDCYELSEDTDCYKSEQSDDEDKGDSVDICEETQKWVPHLYVNNSDYICTHYSDGFEKRKNCDRDKNKIMEQMPKAMNRVAAKLYVNSENSMEFLKAHGLQQWWSNESKRPIVLSGSKLIDQQLRFFIQRPHLKTALESWPILSANLYLLIFNSLKC